MRSEEARVAASQHVPLWAITFADLRLPVRDYNALRYRFQGTWERAWYAAVLCDDCLRRTRNVGRVAFRAIRDGLSLAGFPDPPPRCGASMGFYIRADGTRAWETVCEAHLRVCRTMLEERQ